MPTLRSSPRRWSHLRGRSADGQGPRSGRTRGGCSGAQIWWVAVIRAAVIEHRAAQQKPLKTAPATSLRHLRELFPCSQHSFLLSSQRNNPPPATFPHSPQICYICTHRITEWSGLDLCGSPSPTPCPSRVTQSSASNTVAQAILAFPGIAEPSPPKVPGTPCHFSAKSGHLLHPLPAQG